MGFMNLGWTVSGWGAAIILGWLWLETRDNLATEIERCNTSKVSAIAEASQMAREAEREAAQDEIVRLEAIAASQSKAREIVAQALRESEARGPVVREVVRNVPRSELAAQCLDLPVPAAVFDSVRP